MPHQIGYGLAVPHDGHILALFDQREQARQVRLRLMYVKIRHASILAKEFS
jgi:hypothetical protein